MQASRLHHAEEFVMPITETDVRGDRQDQTVPATAPTRRPWPRWVLAGGLALAVAGFYVLGLHRYLSWDYVRDHLDLAQAAAGENLSLALLMFFLSYAAATALSLPLAAVLTLLAGALFGRWLGTAVVSLASTLGATLAFLSSRYLLRDFVRRHFSGRLDALNRGVEQEGGYYLFTLRLVPAFPFFLVNLGLGLTPMRVWTYTWVSLLGMLPGTFVYVNAGTALAAMDEPGDVLSVGVLVSLALLGLVPLALRKLIQWRVRWRTAIFTVVGLLLVAALGLAVRTYFRYRTAAVMEVVVTEYTNAEYPDDPAHRSVHYGKYTGRKLTLVQKDATHFDFVFEPADARTARVVFRDVDVSLMTPGLPEWTKADPGLTRIALTDRQWNRQQVRFDRGSPHVAITGGDGFEVKHWYTAELAKNCLNAGLWEVLLFVKDEGGHKALYYHGWFTFPLGHYKDIFERNTGLSYLGHWYYLEHWFDPAGTPVPLDGLRRVVREREVPARFDPDEELIVAGEQLGKRRIMSAEHVIAWKDFYGGRKVRFATFLPPGRYSVRHPWKNAYRRMDRFEKAVLREVISPATDWPLHELELVFAGSKLGGKSHFFISGFDLKALPPLPVRDYPRGLYMPMGIGVPPFFQSYEELRKSPPHQGPYFSVQLDDDGRWIDHHKFAIDGPVLHRDADDPARLHVYLLSYERHTLINHLVIDTAP
jgi:uncharacterized membrane protein YdjX (TVP38/TMEM64 family)